VFLCKAVWNCVVSVVFFFADDAIRTWLGAPPADAAYRSMFLALAFTFGLGYWRVSRDLDADRDIVWGGVIGQCCVFAVLAYEVWIAARLPMVFLLMGIVDLVFAVLFTVFLLQTASTRRSAQRVSCASAVSTSIPPIS
jgi:hypothetical protein